MISNVRISNYKSVRECNLNFSKINVFIGPNGSGKSSLLECFEILKNTIAKIGAWSTKSTQPKVMVEATANPLPTFHYVVFGRDTSNKITVEFNFTNLPLSKIVMIFEKDKGIAKFEGQKLRDQELIRYCQDKIFVLRVNRTVDRILRGALSDVNLTGTGNAHQLFYYACYRSEFKENIKHIRDFYSKYGLHDIRWLPLPDGRSYEIAATNELGVDVNIADAGSGFNALFPVIVPLAFYPERTSIFIEHPEMHLHPKLQYELSKFIVEIMKKRGYQIFIETHSEHVLFGLLNAVAKKDLRPDEVSIYSVKKIDGVSKFDEIKVFEDGSIEGELSDFLEPDVDEFMDWLKVWSE